MEIIERFFNLFESIYNYYKDFKTFIANVNEGYFIDYNFETLLQNQEAKRLMIESVHMYGVMLLLLDRLIPALARERLVVCYIRYKGQNSSDFVNEVCKLVRGTGYSYNIKTKVEVMPKNYPLDYFSRYSVDRVLVEYLINAIKDDDVYNQLPAYPNAEHRSVALAQQASILFVLLCFVPKILDKEMTKMREIVDKHFPDNWVIPIYQGHLVDLTSYWNEGYQAASRALSNNIFPDQIKQLVYRHYSVLNQTIKKLDKYTIEGALIEEVALDHTKELMNCLRDANVTLRWLMLHKNC